MKPTRGYIDLFAGLEDAQAEISRLHDGIDELEQYLQKGATLTHHDCMWFLCDVDGEEIVSAPTLRELLYDL